MTNASIAADRESCKTCRFCFREETGPEGPECELTPLYTFDDGTIRYMFTQLAWWCDKYEARGQ